MDAATTKLHTPLGSLAWCYYGIPSTREIKCHIKNDYLDRLSERSDETIANIALTLIHQYDYLMERLIKSIKRRFLEQGGIKEQMYKARLEQRDRQREAQSPQSSRSSQSSQSSQSSRSSQSSQSSLPDNKPSNIIN